MNTFFPAHGNNSIAVRPTILIVDDSEVEAAMLENLLSSQFNIITKLCPINAKNYLRENDVDLILMDVNMPKLSGIELCRKIKSSATTSFIPVVFLTGMHRKEVEQACWEAGCSDFIVKPVFTTLLKRLNMHFDMKNRVQNIQIHSPTQQSNLREKGTWHHTFLKEQCHKANVCNTPMSLIAVKLENYEGLLDNSDDKEIEEHLTLISSLLIQTLGNNINVVMRSNKDRFLCILPDSGPESARHFTFLITQTIRTINETLFNEAKYPIFLKIVGITQSQCKVEPDSMLELLENSVAQPINENINQLSSKFLKQSKVTTHKVYALAG